MLRDYFDDEKYNELKNSSNEIYKALEIVVNLFKNDLDKGGHPYMLHLMYVYGGVRTEEEKVIALLHDVIEDKKVSKEELLDIGFSNKIVEDIVTLTRVKPIEYDDYINNIINNGSKEVLEVKLVDLKNNMDLSRISNPTMKDFQRIEKRYAPAYEKILNKLKEFE